jgi:hypothetical protein
MGIDALAARLALAPAAPPVTSVTAQFFPAVTAKPAPALACTHVTSVTAMKPVTPDADEARARLAGICGHVVGDAGLVSRLYVDVDACAGLPDNALRAYILALADTDLRERGKVPADETAVALCRSCGPVWVAPEVAAVAPAANGVPRVLGCPWCHVRDRRPMARPKVTCGDCRYFSRDAINASEGMGSCKAGCDPARPYPMAEHVCAEWRPIKSANQ